MSPKIVTNVLNQTRMMNCGKTATCIAYRGTHDIDIRFDDGVVVEHKTSQAFFHGCIRHPSLSRTHSRIIKASCINQTVMQNCGMNATCINYRNARDIDVQFEDGTIIEHRCKGCFLKGSILHPKKKRKMKALIEKSSCFGEERLMNNGMKAKCIAYRGWTDIDIQFEDGTIVEHRKKGDFLNGNIRSPEWWEKSFPQRIVYDCIREFYSNAVFNYRPSFLRNRASGSKLELDIWIPELKTGIEYDGFPWHSKETRFSKKKYELIVQSEEIQKVFTLLEKDCIEHKSPKHFNIFIGSTQISLHYDKLEIAINKLLSLLGINKTVFLDEARLNLIREKCKNQNLGMTARQNCGMAATCIAYRDHNDIDVQFEDGTIVKKKSKTAFLKGLIKNPVLYEKEQKKKTIGQTLVMANGMRATCIDYRKSHDIDVQFDDGVIVKHVQKSHFVRGSVKHPDMNPTSLKCSCVGLTLKMNNGMTATCIEYRNCTDIDVRFEDGAIVTHKRKGNFIRGEIDNPNYNRHCCVGKSIKQSCGMTATCINYRNCGDIDVQFEDGTIVRNKQKSQFVAGQIGYPKKKEN